MINVSYQNTAVPSTTKEREVLLDILPCVLHPTKSYHECRVYVIFASDSTLFCLSLIDVEDLI